MWPVARRSLVFGKEIGPYTQEPTLLKSISDLSSEYLNMILQKYSSVDSE